ncbi:hypothetical protein E2C01_069314 [Portunus trituberculatus]|uniref:Uncharacterized protein n=1 Tax=Portunus trituberculatus TaxID=210409 RepID=A0A5B7I2G2_PORTR|nr:hypothetical protein [Portunus trituberculatus]
MSYMYSRCVEVTWAFRGPAIHSIHNEPSSFNTARKKDHIPEIIHPSGTQRYIIPALGEGRHQEATSSRDEC